MLPPSSLSTGREVSLTVSSQAGKLRHGRGKPVLKVTEKAGGFKPISRDWDPIYVLPPHPMEMEGA